LVRIEEDLRAAAHPHEQTDMSQSKLKQTFKEWDVDGNGTISIHELQEIMLKLNPATSSDVLNSLFRSMDRNSDNNVDYAEFIDWLYQDCEAPQAAKPKRVAKAAGAKSMRHNVRIEASYRMNGSLKIFVSTGNIVKFAGGAIVNAANKGCLGGGGVDGAISSAGGPALLAARKALPLVSGSSSTRCPTGEARITIGGGLPARFCIHAVGPAYVKGSTDAELKALDRLLMSAYKSAMSCAAEKQVKSIAFSLISASIFRGPRSLRHVLDLGLEGISAGIYDELEEIHMMAFKPEECEELVRLCQARFAPCEP